jgi:hypothetical protein
MTDLLIGILAGLILSVILWKLKIIKESPFKRPFFKKPFPLEVYPSKNEVRLTLVSIAIFTFIIFTTSLDFDTWWIKIPVKATKTLKSFADTVDSRAINYNSVQIKYSPQLEPKTRDLRSVLVGLLYNDFINILQGLAVFIIGMILVIGFWNFDFQNPFEINVSRPVYQAGFVLIFYGILSYLSILYINNYVRSETNGDYTRTSAGSVLNLILCWGGIILLRLGQVLRKAEKLKKEQDLTI